MANRTSSVRWDLGVLALALASFSAAAWRLWPGAAGMAEAPAGAVLLKAGIAALGLVGFAVRWEYFWPLARARLETLFVLAVCLASTLWAVDPALALQNGLLVVLVWIFGWVVAGQFSSRLYAHLIASAGVMMVLGHMVASQAFTNPAALPDIAEADLSFALIGGLWAAVTRGRWRWVWLAWTVVVAVICGLSGHWVALLAPAIGGLAGLVGLAWTWLGARIIWTPIHVAILVAFLIVALTFGFLFGPIELNLMSDTGPSLLGYGLGVVGSTWTDGFWGGLGLAGGFIVAIWLMVSTFRILFGLGQEGPDGVFVLAVWTASVVGLLSLSDSVLIAGPWIALMAGVSFGLRAESVRPTAVSPSQPIPRPASPRPAHLPPRAPIRR
ncbi:hypothetical protein PbB2_01254 [Candidatus Phycosocius bacilliformis]|uniref:Uncharacterized protein n=1 Tax=Candidatus Phycosocius bacilliformis TaxID=1445552 RepID=A0A2P2E943_9PROT|nr:hypothetical protein [Candidatus Phycosocius bacilliformis]GBF57586.1 hypothetical protein PbB2_01254 [Candidatus Phycosocius bacilliformis]